MYWDDREGSYGGVTHKWLMKGADMVVTVTHLRRIKEDDVKKNSSGGGD